MILASVAFLVCILYRSSKPQNWLKFCFSRQCFTYDTIQITNDISISYSQSKLTIFEISKFRFKNTNSFYLLLLLLLGDITLNPGPFTYPEIFKQKGWRAFSNTGLHLIPLNINILVPKREELRDIAERTKAAVIVISEM